MEFSDNLTCKLPGNLNRRKFLKTLVMAGRETAGLVLKDFISS